MIALILTYAARSLEMQAFDDNWKPMIMANEGLCVLNQSNQQ